MRSARIEIDGYETDYIIFEIGTIQNDRTFEWVEPYYPKESGRGKLQRRIRSILPTVDLIFRRKTYTFKLKDLVAKYFLPNPYNFPHVNYIDKDVTNNSVNNLYWSNTRPWITPNTPEQIEKACQMIVSKQFTNDEICKECNITNATIHRLKYEGFWRNISNEYGLPYPSDEPELVWNDEIRNYAKQRIVECNLKTDDIANELGLPVNRKFRELVRILRYELRTGRRTLNGYKVTVPYRPEEIERQKKRAAEIKRLKAEAAKRAKEKEKEKEEQVEERVSEE